MKYAISDSQVSMFDVGLIEDEVPNMPILDVSRCEVKEINYETAARMVETYHYAHRVPSIKVSIGLYIDSVLSGCIYYSTVFNNIGASICGDDFSSDVLELSRLFTFDYVPRNSETMLISKSYSFIRKSLPYIKILLSYADSGEGHIGYVYQAANWLYTGMSRGSTEFELNGDVVSSRNEAFRDSTSNKRGTLIPYDILKKKYPSLKKIRTSKKYRYVYFLGSKSQKKALGKALKWPILPYPKEI